MGISSNSNTGNNVSDLGISNTTLSPDVIAAAENYTKTGGTGDQNQAFAKASGGIQAKYDSNGNLTGYTNFNGDTWNAQGQIVGLTNVNHNKYTIDPTSGNITSVTANPKVGKGVLGDLGGLAPVLGIGALLLAPELAPELSGSLGGTEAGLLGAGDYAAGTAATQAALADAGIGTGIDAATAAEAAGTAGAAGAAEAAGAAAPTALTPGTVLANGATVTADGSLIAADGTVMAGPGSAAVTGGADSASLAAATGATPAAATGATPAAATNTTAAATAAPTTTPTTSFDSFGNPVAAGSPAATLADPTGLAQAQLDANAAAAAAAGAGLQGASIAAKLLGATAGITALTNPPKAQERGLQSATQCFGPQPTFKWNINKPAAVSNGIAYGQQMLTPDYSPAAAPAPAPGATITDSPTTSSGMAEGGLASLHTSHVGNLLHAVQSQGFPLDHHTLAKIKHLKSIGAPDHHVIGFLHHEKRLAGGGTLGHYSDGGQFLKGPGDGMSDDIPANIAGKQEARLANEEFVIPADVVSHLGNGSSEAGAKVLYKMMHQVRKDRTGNPEQGKQINPDKYMPA